ncbi:MAG: polyprenol monophosphomannose synthase [Rhodothermus sp.]|nr:polyprenol monophosphomannose synthase [Rhodothermus sp.]
MAASSISHHASDTLVIIPTYNEAQNVERLLPQVLELPCQVSVLVVDDASPDGTAARVAALQARYPDRLFLIERTGKLGLGSAYLTGFRFGLERGYTYLAEMDADLSHDPEDLPRLLDPLRRNEADLVIGSRYIGGIRIINWPLSRLILSYFAGLYTRLITCIPILDVTSGFKCYHRRVLEAIDLDRIRSNGYSFQIEMKYRAWRKGFRLLEVPIIFTDRQEGSSKMSKAIVWEAAWKVWELRLRALLGRL